MKKILQYLRNSLLFLFFTSILQVILVASNVIFISSGMILPMCITGFSISYIWALNVKKITSGNGKEKFAYALGAMFGTLIGYFTAHYLQQNYG